MKKTSENTPLRVCRVCGLEAHTAEDLEQFTKNPSSTHGRALICRICYNQERLNRYYSLSPEEYRKRIIETSDRRRKKHPPKPRKIGYTENWKRKHRELNPI